MSGSHDVWVITAAAASAVVTTDSWSLMSSFESRCSWVSDAVAVATSAEAARIGVANASVTGAAFVPVIETNGVGVFGLLAAIVFVSLLSFELLLLLAVVAPVGFDFSTRPSLKSRSRSSIWIS